MVLLLLRESLVPIASLPLDWVHYDREIFNKLLLHLLRIFIQLPDRFLVLNSIRPFTRCPTIVIQVIWVLGHSLLCLVLQVANIVKFHVRLLQRGAREDAVEFRMIDIAPGRLADAPEVKVRLDVKSPESIAV
jgi:hypothetical protein